MQNPILPIYREREVRFVTAQTGARLLCVPGTWRGFDYAAMARAIAREQAGLNPSGPRFVVTELAVLGFNAATKRMQLESLHPGVSVGLVQERTGFPLLVPDAIPITPPPTDEELAILRHRVNPHGRLLPREA